MFVPSASTQSRLGVGSYRGSSDSSGDYHNRYGGGFSSRSPTFDNYTTGNTLPRRSGGITSSAVRPLPVGPTSVTNGQYDSSTASTVRSIPIRRINEPATNTGSLGRRTISSAISSNISKPPLPSSAYERISSSSLGSKYQPSQSPDLRHHNALVNRFLRSSSTDRSPSLYQRQLINDEPSYRLSSTNASHLIDKKIDRLSDQIAPRASSAMSTIRRLSNAAQEDYLSSRPPSPGLSSWKIYPNRTRTRTNSDLLYDEEERDVLPSLMISPSMSNGVGSTNGVTNYESSRAHAGLYRSRAGAFSVPDVPTYAKRYVDDNHSDRAPSSNGYNKETQWIESNSNSIERQELEDDDEESGTQKATEEDARKNNAPANHRRPSLERNGISSVAANGYNNAFVKNEPSRSSTSSVDSTESSRLSSSRGSNTSDGISNSRNGDSGRYIRDDDYGDTKKLGLVGLRNLGNTCFMNSVIQCLSNTRPLREYCLQSSSSLTTDINNNTTSRMKGALMKAFRELLSELWTTAKGGQVSPDKFKTQIQKFAPRFTGYSQQDAQEFLRYLLQGLHEDINRVQSRLPALPPLDESLPDSQKAVESWKRYLRVDDSKVVDLFVGQLKSELKCTFCGHVSVTFDPFWDLSLTIPQDTKKNQVSLYDCFEAFTREEILDGDEKPTCESCKTRRRCTKKFLVQKYPSILVLHLKRFSGERYRSRLSTLVEFPVTQLDLSAFASMKSGITPLYDLYAVSNHCGTPLTGHYTAYCMNAASGRWYLYDDTRVTPVNERSVISSEAYVLFYELGANSSSSRL